MIGWGRVMKHRNQKTGLLPGILLLVCCLLAVGPQSVLAGSAKSQTSGKSTVLKSGLTREKGKRYYYNSRGNKIKNQWKSINGYIYYFQKDGAAATGITEISGSRYLFTNKGRLVQSSFYTWKGKTYYANKKGRIYTGWHTINGKEYYFNSDGTRAEGCWIQSKYLNKKGVYKPAKKKSMKKLKEQLQKTVRSYSGTWSVYVKNLDTGEEFSINNQKIYAASLIKLYAMGACYEKVRQGSIRESSISSTVNSMITVSSNDAFNTIVRKVGINYINTWCRQNGYTGTNQGHGLSPSGNNYGLSNGSGSNMTTVKDCGRFLASVYDGTCVNKKYSAKMLEHLKKQTRRWKTPAGVPSGTVVANKTGETDDTTHDAAIVYSKGCTYILCVMGRVPGGAWGASGRITSLSKTVYNFFN